MSDRRLGSAIKHERLVRGLSQTDLGRCVETDQGTISEFETGARRPGVDMLRRLAGALDVPYNRLAELAGYLDPRADREPGELPPALVMAMQAMIRDHPELKEQFAAHADDEDFPAQVRDLARALGYVVRGFLADE